MLRVGAHAFPFGVAIQEADADNASTAHTLLPRRKRDLNSLIDELHPYAEMLSDGVNVGSEQKQQRKAFELAAEASAGGRRPRRSCSMAVNYAETENRYNDLQGTKQARQTTVEQLLATFDSSTLQQPSLAERKAEQGGPDATMDIVRFAIGVRAAAAGVTITSARMAAVTERAVTVAQTSALEAPAPFVAVRSTVASLLRSGRLRRSLARAQRCSTNDTEGALRLLVLNTLQVDPEESSAPWALAPWEGDETRFASARHFVWKGVTPFTLPRCAGAALVGCRVGVWWDGEAVFRAARVLRYCAELETSAFCAAGTHVLRYEESGLLVAENLELAGEPLCWKLLEEEGSSRIEGGRRATASSSRGPVRSRKRSRADTAMLQRSAASEWCGRAGELVVEAIAEEALGDALEEAQDEVVVDTANEGTARRRGAEGSATKVGQMNAEMVGGGDQMAMEHEAVNEAATVPQAVVQEAILEETARVVLLDTEAVIGDTDDSEGEGWKGGVWHVERVDVLSAEEVIASAAERTAGERSVKEGAAEVGAVDGAFGAWAFRARVETLMSMQAQSKQRLPPKIFLSPNCPCPSRKDCGPRLLVVARREESRYPKELSAPPVSLLPPFTSFLTPSVSLPHSKAIRCHLPLSESDPEHFRAPPGWSRLSVKGTKAARWVENKNGRECSSRVDLEELLEKDSAAQGKAWLGQLVGGLWELRPRAVMPALTEMLNGLVARGLVQAVPPQCSGKSLPMFVVRNQYVRGEPFPKGTAGLRAIKREEPEEEGDMCDLEMERKHNMARNQELLRQLGLA